MKKGQGNPFRREALFGGRGEVLVWDLLGKEALRPFTAVLACELEAGGFVGPHVQSDFAEIVVFTEGEGRVEVSGEARDVGEGSLVPLPLGKVLSIENLSKERPLRYLIIKAEPSTAK